MSAVGQLAAGVAHEINNPLGVILGFAEISVRQIKEDDPLAFPLKSIEREAVRCKNLVQDLLTFSRVSKLEREPMDLNKTVQVALSLVTAHAKMTQVTVKTDLAPNLPHFLGNLSQVQQIIINIANNAIDAMGEVGVLTIKTELINEGPLSWIGLRMMDSGPGIPDHLVSKIFEPFFTTKPVGKGTGLGLSLVHEIVKKHSGIIDVTSQPGHTEFFVKFPVRTADTATAGRSAMGGVRAA
jgi:signal transduction histidine kinase